MRTQLTVVRNATELSTLWRELMGPGSFARRRLWVVFFDLDGRVEPVIMPIDDIPSEPEAGMVDEFAAMLAELVETEELSATAFLISRPGPPAMTASDRAWARMLATLPDDRLRRWPVHLATRDEVRVFAPDDLLDSGNG